MKTKKIILIIVIMIIVILGVVSCLAMSYYYSANKSDYYYTINSLIKDYTFAIAKVTDEKIVLYSADGEQIGSVDFKESCKKQNPVYIRKEGNNLFFVESVAVDDETGVMFVNDGSDELLNGIWSIKRVGGNSYKYSTAK